MLFLVLTLFKNVFLGLGKGISKQMHQVAAKHTANLLFCFKRYISQYNVYVIRKFIPNGLY